MKLKNLNNEKKKIKKNLSILKIYNNKAFL
jgi:hypothetical protein